MNNTQQVILIIVMIIFLIILVYFCGSPEDLDDDEYYEYEEVMFKCLDSFYSNNYEIIVIESKNGGGYSELCIPMTQYLRPKILGTVPTSQKDTDLNYEYFMKGDENINPETCKPYDSRENFSRNKVDDYGNGVTHNRTKEFELDYKKLYSKKSEEIQDVQLPDINKLNIF